MLDWADLIGGVALGFLLSNWAGFARKIFGKPALPPAPLPPRDIGDIVKHSETGLPVVLTEKLSHDKFKATFITPHCGKLGAKIRGDAIKPLEEFLAKYAQDRGSWPDYLHPLSDEEHRNYGIAMLRDKQ
jgi:hypothetical protein